MAAPSVSDVGGTILDGQQINISGIGFKIKSPVAPLLWDNFEDGSDGSRLSTKERWVSLYGGTGGYYNSVDKYSGNLAAYQTYVNPYPMGEVTNNFFFPTEQMEVYYSYVTKYVGSVGDGVFKNGRICANAGSNPPYNGPGNASWSMNSVGYSTGGGLDGVEHSPDPNGSVTYDNNGLGLRDGNWHRLELYKKMSTPGVADGIFWGNIDSDDGFAKYANSRSRTNYAVMTRGVDETYLHYGILLGLMHTSGTGTSKIWVDDVYVDNTQARIELCSGSIWSTRTHCEPQIPKITWNDSNISATVNQGTISNGTAYLYVVDKDGNVNASGYAITIGSPSTYTISNFTTLVSSWFHLGSGNVSDFNFDNVVNTKDLGVMMSKWE